MSLSVVNYNDNTAISSEISTRKHLVSILNLPLIEKRVHYDMIACPGGALYKTNTFAKISIQIKCLSEQPHHSLVKTMILP